MRVSARTSYGTGVMLSDCKYSRIVHTASFCLCKLCYFVYVAAKGTVRTKKRNVKKGIANYVVAKLTSHNTKLFAECVAVFLSADSAECVVMTYLVIAKATLSVCDYENGIIGCFAYSLDTIAYKVGLKYAPLYPNRADSTLLDKLDDVVLVCLLAVFVKCCVMYEAELLTQGHFFKFYFFHTACPLCYQSIISSPCLSIHSQATS